MLDLPGLSGLGESHIPTFWRLLYVAAVMMALLNGAKRPRLQQRRFIHSCGLDPHPSPSVSMGLIMLQEHSLSVHFDHDSCLLARIYKKCEASLHLANPTALHTL